MQIDWNVIKSILATLSPILLMILGGIGWLYKHEKERREAVERQLSEHKYRAYITLLEIFFDIIKTVKTSKNLIDNKLIARMFDANKDLLLYGSDDVIKTYHTWLGSARNGQIKFDQFANIIISIRRDMGNQKTEITADQVLRQFIVDYDDAKSKGLL